MTETPFVRALQQCSLHSLILLTTKALGRSGFGDVQILDRRQSKQRSRYGGHELECRVIVGTLPMKVIVKVINDSVRVRMLDELAGAVVRTKADLGLIVTPHHVTANAARHQGTYRGARVEIMDGKKLSDLLRHIKVGIRPYGDVDYAFFEALEEVSQRMLAFIAANSL